MDVGGMFWTKTFGDDDNEDDGDDDDEERADKLCLLHLCLLVHNSWKSKTAHSCSYRRKAVQLQPV